MVLLHGCVVSKYTDWLTQQSYVTSNKVTVVHWSLVGTVFRESDRDVMGKTVLSKFTVANRELRHHRRLRTTSPHKPFKIHTFLYIELLRNVWMEDFWFQTFAVFWMLYAFFWVIPWRLNFICRRFGTLCLFHLHRRISVEWLSLRNVGVFIGKKGLVRK